MAKTDKASHGVASLATSVDTTGLIAAPAAAVPAGAGQTAGENYPDPQGTKPGEEAAASQGKNTDPTGGTGVEGEVEVWEASYSRRNFIGRGLGRLVLTVGWVSFAAYTWGMGHENLGRVVWFFGALLVILWIALLLRMLQAHYSHHYQLTNRRLFIATGIIQRRKDMMELLRVKDVFIRQQSLFDRWLGLGTVVVVPSETQIPTFYLTGVNDPQQVMDLIWHHARTERDLRTIKVDEV